MENIRNYFECVLDFMIEEISKNKSLKDYSILSLEAIGYKIQRKNLENIANKLLAMNKEDRVIYAKLAIEQLHNWYCSFQCFGRRPVRMENNIYVCEYSGIKYEITSIVNDVNSFISDFFYSLYCFNIDSETIIHTLQKESDGVGMHECLCELCKEQSKYRIPISKIIGKTKQPPKATIPEQVDVVQTLLRGANITNYDNTKLAEFVSWLCGGSAETIRQRISSVGYDNEEALKEKFALLKVKYNEGKIEKDR